MKYVRKRGGGVFSREMHLPALAYTFNLIVFVYVVKVAIGIL